MARLLPALSVLLAAGLIATGCGGSDSSDSSDSGGSSDSGAAKAPSNAGSAKGKADVQAEMKNIQFNPMKLTVKRGQIVRWTNNDSVTHNVTKEKGPGADFKSANVAPGGTYQAKFDTPGTIAYVCTIHPNQTGTITVK